MRPTFSDMPEPRATYNHGSLSLFLSGCQGKRLVWVTSTQPCDGTARSVVCRHTQSRGLDSECGACSGWSGSRGSHQQTPI